MLPRAPWWGWLQLPPVGTQPRTRRGLEERGWLLSSGGQGCPSLSCWLWGCLEISRVLGPPALLSLGFLLPRVPLAGLQPRAQQVAGVLVVTWGCWEAAAGRLCSASSPSFSPSSELPPHSHREGTGLQTGDSAGESQAALWDEVFPPR